jgi:hypothetical protein
MNYGYADDDYSSDDEYHPLQQFSNITTQSVLVDNMHVNRIMNDYKIENSSPETTDIFVNSSRIPLRNIPYTHSELPFGSSYASTSTPAPTPSPPPSTNINQINTSSYVFIRYIRKCIKWYILSFVMLFTIQSINTIISSSIIGKILSIVSIIFAVVCIVYIEKIRREWLT